jgi:hypothetical protein
MMTNWNTKSNGMLWCTITTTVYTFGGSATDATVTDLPTGLTSVVDTAAKTVTISGIQLLLVPTQ